MNENSIIRRDIQGSKQPNFIGCWNIDQPSICDDMISFFENSPTKHKKGTTGREFSEVQETVKKCTGMEISPLDLGDKEYQVVSTYINYLKVFFYDYLEQWDFLKTFLPKVNIGTFLIQKYEPGDHFSGLHAERTSLNTLHRTLVWMTYLNDVKKGGETEFPMYGLRIRPQRGQTLIWPAEWTHAHRATMVETGNKYIVTGWMHYPYDAHPWKSGTPPDTGVK